MKHRDKTQSNPGPRFLRGLVICLVAFLVAALGTRYLRLFSDAAATIEDLQISQLAPLPQPDDITVLAITEDVLAGYEYRSPINRGYLNELVLKTLDKGARLVALDIIFDQPTNRELDDRLRETLTEHSDSIVVAIGDDAESGLTERQVAWQQEYLDGITTGFADIPTIDNVVREFYPGREDDPVARPSFVAAIARKHGIEPPTTPVRLHLQNRSIEGPPIRNYVAGLSNMDIYLDDWFEDKIVLIGVDLPGTDQWQTPLSRDADGLGTMAGVMIHAQALAQIIQGRTYPTTAAATDVAILALAVVAGYLLPLASIPVAMQALAGAAGLSLYWVLAFMLPSINGLIMPVVAPTAGFIACATLSAAHAFHRTNRQKRFLTNAFRHYVSPAIIDEVIARPEKLALGGEKRELSFVFCDLEGFTSLSERLDPEVVVAELQKYFDGLLRIALENGGTIDRLVGDGMAVIFGAPVEQPDHAERAVACALEMDRFSENFRADRAAEGIGWGITRIGVHTGPAVVGNVGSSEHFHYTANGDCVNTASRLEGANRILGTRLCISRVAADRSPDPGFRPIGKLVLKGRQQSLECVTSRGELNDDQLQRYAHGYRLLEQEDKAAVGIFESLAEQLPKDGPIAMHLDRSRTGLLDTEIVLEEK